MRIRGGVSEKERNHSNVRVLGHYERGSERSENAITAISRFLHWKNEKELVFELKSKIFYVKELV